MSRCLRTTITDPNLGARELSRPSLAKVAQLLEVLHLHLLLGYVLELQLATE
jgi:hypothetical protein